MKLKNVISETQIPLGTTPIGQDWCMKALHPADQATPVSVPDSQSRPSAFLAFQGQYKIAPTGLALAATDTWDCDILLTGDMISPGAFSFDKTGAYSGGLLTKNYFNSGSQRHFLNAQLTGSGATQEEAYQAKLATVTANIREARLAYSSCTLDLQAPALSNQGVINCVQYEVPDDVFTGCYISTVSDQLVALKTIQCTHWDQFATFDTIQSLPNAYTGKAVDGVYAVHKLSPEDLHYRNMRQTQACHSGWNPVTSAEVQDQIPIHASTGVTGPIGCCRDLTVATPSGVGSWIQDERLPRFTDRVIHICCRGLAPTSTFYLTVRSGYEITVSPGSIYSPYVRNPVPVDDVAQKAYFAISRQLKDAYPSEYNSLEMLLPVIAELAGQVLPALLPKAVDLGKRVYEAFKHKSGEKRDQAIVDKSTLHPGLKN
jgi:hypothetical protein